MSDDHRKARLRHLIATDYDNQEHFGKVSGRGKSRVSQMAGHTEPFGERAASLLAEALRLPSDWFNNTWPTPKEAQASGGRTNAPAPKPSPPAAVDVEGAANIVMRLGELLDALDATDRAMAKVILENLATDPQNAPALASKMENLLGGFGTQSVQHRQKMN